MPFPKELPNTKVKTNFCLVGDEIFPLQPNIMKPYSRTQLQNKERIFNYRLSRARRTIENTFGILTTRWQILLSTICADPKNIDFMILAIVCLHNFIMSEKSAIIPNKRPYCPPHLVDREQIGGKVMDGSWRLIATVSELFRNIGRLGSNNYKSIANAQKDILRDYFVSEVGESQTPWQYDYVFGNDK